MKIVYFGTPPFAADVLDYLAQHQITILAIVTKPDKPRGRSGKLAFSAVKELAREKYGDIPLFQPDKASTKAFAEKLRLLGADLFVVVAYGEIINQELLDLPRYGCINLHASLLPQYRGAAPIQYALLEGAKKSGVTIIEMSLKMDAGAILAQKEVLIPSEMNLEELEGELCKTGCETLLKVIKQFENQSITKTPQNHTQATYVQKIDSSRAQIDWKKPANKVHNQIRAFSPRPGAWCTVEIGGHFKRIKIYRTQVEEGLGDPGETLSFGPQGWRVACQEGVISILEVQLEGKKRLSIKDFSRGVSSAPKIKI